MVRLVDQLLRVVERFRDLLLAAFQQGLRNVERGEGVHESYFRFFVPGKVLLVCTVIGDCVLKEALEAIRIACFVVGELDNGD